MDLIYTLIDEMTDDWFQAIFLGILEDFFFFQLSRYRYLDHAQYYEIMNNVVKCISTRFYRTCSVGGCRKTETASASFTKALKFGCAN